MANASSKLRAALYLCTLGLVLFGAYLYLFRKVTVVSIQETAELRFEWGALREVAFDLDQDGLFDFKGRVGGWSSQSWAPGDSFDSAAASSACNGEFDVEIDYNDDGTHRELRFDSDGDGVTEAHSPLEGFKWMATKCNVWRRWTQQQQE